MKLGSVVFKMVKKAVLLTGVLVLTACDSPCEPVFNDNFPLSLDIPSGFPSLNNSVNENWPTKYGVKLGQKLFRDKRLSADNSISCSSCHIQEYAFADRNMRAVGIKGREGIRNVPSVQNLAFMKFYNWDGNMLQLEKQPLVPIITHEEMDSAVLDVINKIKDDAAYSELFTKAFGDAEVTAERIYRSIAQYEYTLISAGSKYDKVMRNEGMVFSPEEERGFAVFEKKCAGCHSTALFTDESFRNVGFPVNPDRNEAGRARVTGRSEDYMSFRVPSLRNVEYTAPYGSFGQFATLKEVLDYFDSGVLDAANLDPYLKSNGNRIPLTEQEKTDLISFMKTLSDTKFTQK